MNLLSQITKLKVANNPFAKGFRESGGQFPGKSTHTRDCLLEPGEKQDGKTPETVNNLFAGKISSLYSRHYAEGCEECRGRISAAYRLGNTAPKKHRSDGESLAILCRV